MTKWKGEVASYAPYVAELVSIAGRASAGALVAVLLTAAGPATAADRYWDVNQTAAGSGGAGVWNLGNLFWSNNSSDTLGPYNQPWSNGDSAIFGGTAGMITLGAPITANGVAFNTSGYTLAGVGANILTLGGATPTITATGNATISAVIAGTAGLTKAGAGILTLTGANTFTGGVVVNGGELSVASNAALGAASNTVTLNGTTLTATGALSTSREIVINGDVRISGGGVGSALFTGNGTLSIFRSVTMNNDASTYTGTTITNGFGTAGTVRFTSVRNTGLASSLGASGDIIFRGTNSYIGTGDTTNRAFRIQPSSNTSAGLINSGTGTLALTGTISLEGGPRGIFFSADTADLALSGPISGTISGNAVVTYDGGGTARTITLAGANTYTNANSIGTVTLAVSTLTDRGTASSLGTNDDTGAGLPDIQINGGALSYTGDGDSSNRTWKISNSSSVLNNGTGALALTGAVTFDPVASIDTLTLGGSSTSENTISGDITGTGRVIMNGAGTWVLSGNNSYTDTTTVANGTLRAGSATAFNQLSSVTVNGGTLDLGGYDYSFTRLDGTGGAVELGSGDLTVNVATGGTPTYAGTIQGSGGFTKRGGGTQTLIGASTYTGDTNVEGGTLALDFSPAGGPTSNIVSSASTLNLAGGTVQIIGAAGQANSQTFDGLNITAGSNRITATAGASGGTMVVNFGDVARTGGQIDFGIGSGVTMSVAPGTTLGGWATVNGSDYADVDASNNIVAFTNYDLEDNAGTWGDGDIVTDTGGAANTPFFGTVSDSGGDNIVQLGGLRYTVARNSTVSVGPGQTLGLDGTIIVASSVGGTSQTISGGSVRGAAGGVLGVQQNSTGTFTIGSTIVDNGGATGLTVGGIGTGSVVLGNAANTYTGATWVTRGRLSVATLANGGANSSIGASSDDSSNLVLEGGTLSYTGGSVTTDRGFTLMRSGAITGGTIEVTQSSTNLSFGGEIVSPDGAGLTKTGSGRLTLANANSSYTGATVVTGGGTLSVAMLANGSTNSSIGASSNASANLFIEGGSTFQYTGASVTSDRGFTLNGTAGGIIDVSNAGTELTLAGTAVGLGSAPLTKVGAGTLTLSGINTYTGQTRVNAGTLRAGSTQAFGVANLVVMADAAGATLDLDGFDNKVAGLSGGGTNGGNLLLGDAVLTIGGTNASYSGAISGTGGLIKDNTSVQTMVGCNNSYTGSTTIRAGVLSVDCIRDGGEASGIGASDADPDSLVITNNGILEYTGGTVTTDRGFHLAGGWGVIDVTQAGTTLEFTGNVTNASAGGLGKLGAGTLKLSGTNNFAGGIYVRQGTLIAGSSNAFGTGFMTIYADATVDMTGFSNEVGALNDGAGTAGEILIGSETLTLSSGGATFTGKITGTTGSLVKNGGGTQTLAGCNSSYGGATTINGGWIYANCIKDGGLNSSIGASSADAGNLVIGGTGAAGLQYTGSESTSTNRRFTMGNTAYLKSSGTGTINFTSTEAITHTGTGTRQLRLGGTNTGTNVLAAQIVDNGASAVSLVKEEAGTWQVSNTNNSYTGATSIAADGGVLEVTKLANGGENSSIGRSTAVAGNLIIGTNGTLRYVGSGDSTNRLFTLGTGTTIIASSGTGALNFTDSGGLMGFTGTGARTFTLGGTYAGNNIMGVTIRDQSGTAQTSLAKNDAGTWILTANNTYTGNTVINAGKLIIGNGGTVGNVGTGEVILAFSTGTLGFNRSDVFTFAGKISGPGTIEQMGEGTTILTAVNSAGSTKISEGTLQVNGDLTTDTIVFEDDETTTLIVNGAVHGAAGAPAIITGDASANIITINSGGALTANGDLGDGMDVVTVSGTLATGGGQLNLGAGNDTLVLNDTAVFAGAGVNGGAGTGDVLRVNNGSARTLAGSQVGGFESLVKTLGGTLTLTGSHGFSAGTSVDAGTLIVDGSLGSGPVTVATGATLGGNGTAGGSVTIANGATLAPGSAGGVPGTLTVGGNLTLNSGSTLAYNFGQANTVGGALNDHTIVGGNLRLDGTLNMTVSAGGTFAPGFYRVFTYSGTLDNQGLTLGAGVPSGVTVDTATAGQVNLLNTGNLTLNFWDGGASGNHFDDVAQGGNGVWQSTGGNVNWTDEPGNGTSVNASWTDAGFAIFQGSAGTVTVDNTPASVTTAGMQFRTNGYVIDGEPLTLVPLGSGNAVIRVGEGAASDSAITATISAQLTGSTGLTKTDGGRLILTAANTYSGQTVITGGVIQVAAENALGANGTLVLEGGTLNTTTSFALGKTITLNGPGGALDVNGGTTLTAGTIAGAGALTKAGGGTLVLTGSNTYSGGTNFNAGVVSISAADNLGTGPLTFNGGMLSNTAPLVLALGGTINAPGGTIETLGDLTIEGNLSGAGALTKTGGEMLVLTGTNSYSGGTTVSEGTLQLGNGGATGSIIGNVALAAEGELHFNRDSTTDYTFEGVISGDGDVNQVGSGVTILTADNTYRGETAVTNGTLVVNGDQTAATGPTVVLAGATLGGNGTIGGNVFVEGTVAPGDAGSAPGTLTINGNLTLFSGSTLAYQFGQPDVVGGGNNDHTIVGGDLDMQGAEIDVSVTPGGTFGPGVYRVITYSGNLVNDGLSLGDVPAESDLFIDTATSGQVNLVNTFGAMLTYWDGAANDDNGVIDGGDGVWQNGDLASNINWTDSPSTLNGRWSDEAFAIFQGSAGTVQVDNSNGAVTASGMQFLVSGYEITGQPLTLVPWSSDGNAIVRVGSGAPGDDAMTATISAELTGDAGLTKTDGGRLILTAANSHTGATVIEGGVIQIAAENALGVNSSLVLQGGTLNTTTSFALGKDISLEGPGGALDVNETTTLELTGLLSGSGALEKTGTGTLLQSIAGADTHTGATTIAQGTLRAGNAGVLSIASAYSVLSGATLDLDGFNQTIASLDNAGDVRLDGAPGTVLTITGNYVGSGGTIYLNTALGDDVSPTDRVLVGGDTSGTAVLAVSNVGGAGVPTVEGIKLVDVAGTSAGTFTLQGDYVFEGDQAVVGGAYAYRLYQGSVSEPTDGDWYLRSALIEQEPLYQAGVPIYEAYAGALQSFNQLGTLQQRLGNRSWTVVAEGADAISEETKVSRQIGIWARIEGAHADFEPETSTSGADYDVSLWRLQAGVDTVLSETANGQLIGGVAVHFGTVSSHVESIFGSGGIDATGYGVSGTLTWYGDGGFYVDGQAQVTGYDSDLFSSSAGVSLVDGNNGFGYALGVEVGQRIPIHPEWAITPQAQLSWASVDFDDFDDAFGANVSLAGADALIGRLGLAIDRQSEWVGANGKSNRTHLYAIGNLYYDFEDGTSVDVAGTPFDSEIEALWGGLGVGGAYSWADDKYALYGEALAKTSLEQFGNSHVLNATVGFRASW